MLKAVTRQASSVDAKIKNMNASRDPKHQITTAYFFDHYSTPEDIAVMVTEQDFLDAHRELIPSVSAGELAHYEKVRATFEGGRESQAKQNPPPLERRPVSSQSRSSFKGKGKAIMGKGKGKALAIDSDNEYDDYGLGPEGINGKSKGKGKAVASFEDGTASDDEGLYE